MHEFVIQRVVRKYERESPAAGEVGPRAAHRERRMGVDDVQLTGHQGTPHRGRIAEPEREVVVGCRHRWNAQHVGIGIEVAPHPWSNDEHAMPLRTQRRRKCRQ